MLPDMYLGGLEGWKRIPSVVCVLFVSSVVPLAVWCAFGTSEYLLAGLTALRPWRLPDECDLLNVPFSLGSRNFSYFFWKQMLRKSDFTRRKEHILYKFRVLLRGSLLSACITTSSVSCCLNENYWKLNDINPYLLRWPKINGVRLGKPQKQNV